MSNLTPPPSAKPPLTVWLFFFFSWLLGWLMALDGLYQRVWAATAPWSGPWTAWLSGWGLGPLDLGWPLIVAGLSLIGASFGLYLRRSWGYLTGLLVGGLALSYGTVGAVLGLVCLALLVWPATRAYLASASTGR
jgi:hypothetical protein